MLRASFFVDGFNLYHSLMAAEYDLYTNSEASNTKWLDLHSLFRFYIPVIANRLSTPHAKLKIDVEQVFYFSAYAKHREHDHPGCTERHRDYVRCLESHGVIAEMGMFKRRSNGTWEEKESDVAMAVRLTEQAIRQQCDVAVIVTGDTDIAPAIRLLRHMCPELRIVTLFPYRRKNDELEKLVDVSINMTRRSYVKCQYAPKLELSSGVRFSKPPKW